MSEGNTHDYFSVAVAATLTAEYDKIQDDCVTLFSMIANGSCLQTYHRSRPSPVLVDTLGALSQECLEGILWVLHAGSALPGNA